MRTPLKLRSLAVLAGLVLAASVPAAAQATRPNIVFIISDDHAWTDYGFMGHKQIETPNLDRLAARSALFTRGYVPTALCRPALATFASGFYAHQHQISGNDPAFLPEMLAPAAGKAKKAAKAGKQAGEPAPTAEPAAYQQLRERLIAKLDGPDTLPKILGRQGYLSHQSGKWWEGSYQRGG